MLSGYYFLGLGNDTEGYTLLSGENLQVSYVYPRLNSNIQQIISVYPFVNSNNYKQPIFNLPISGETSGYLIPITGWNENVKFDVNSIYRNYFNTTTTNIENFGYTDAFILSSTFNLFKTSNRLHETEYYGRGDDSLEENYHYFWYVKKQYYKLMVPQNLIDLSIIKSDSENIYEFLDQFNVSLNDALMSGYMPTWYSGRIKMPISNYGKNLPVSSEIYSFEDLNNRVYYGTKPFFGLATSSIFGEVKYYSKDVYVKNSENKFKRATSGYNSYEEFFNEFTFNETKYILSGSNKFADLYKNQNIYFPIKCYENSISSDISYFNTFYISQLGIFDIPSGEYINNCLNYISDPSGTLYNLGNWEDGLHYTSDETTSIICEDFTISEAPSSEFNNYPRIIGVKKISEDQETYYSANTVLKGIQNVPNKMELYIAIDPQSYVIAL